MQTPYSPITFLDAISRWRRSDLAVARAPRRSARHRLGLMLVEVGNRLRGERAASRHPVPREGAAGASV